MFWNYFTVEFDGKIKEGDYKVNLLIPPMKDPP